MTPAAEALVDLDAWHVIQFASQAAAREAIARYARLRQQRLDIEGRAWEDAARRWQS